jgi:hypothetical protein
VMKIVSVRLTGTFRKIYHVTYTIKGVVVEAMQFTGWPTFVIFFMDICMTSVT